MTNIHGINVPRDSQLIMSCYRDGSPLHYVAHTSQLECDRGCNWESGTVFLAGYRRWTRSFIAITIILLGLTAMWGAAAFARQSFSCLVVTLGFFILTLISCSNLVPIDYGKE